MVTTLSMRGISTAMSWGFVEQSSFGYGKVDYFVAGYGKGHYILDGDKEYPSHLTNMPFRM